MGSLAVLPGTSETVLLLTPSQKHPSKPCGIQCGSLESGNTLYRCVTVPLFLTPPPLGSTREEQKNGPQAGRLLPTHPCLGPWLLLQRLPFQVLEAILTGDSLDPALRP
ncbi:hypothetical protein VULLAG_LOCUS22089 [Vulpes lagopus]